MQQILYADAPYSILWYNTLVQAFRTDTWTGYSHVPRTQDGAAFRNMLRGTYVNLKPVTATENTTESGSNIGVIVAVIVAVVAVAAIVAFCWRGGVPKTSRSDALKRE